ncbi:MAG: hypothetical protein Q7R69_03205 [bacterium]|nr:hypothetical protein [bacterium]
MGFFYLLPFYTRWHYTDGLKDLLHNWKNLILFVRHFFSLGLLFRTWFAPFGRLDEEYQKGLNPEVFFETLVVNTLMRMVGFVLKTFVMTAGLLVLLLLVIAGPVAFVLWALVPLIILFLFSLGAINLFI